MDIELFYLWVNKLLIPKTAHLKKPILLVCDGHGSHLDLRTIDLLDDNKIILYCLPPHTTNILQPLDVSIFRPLKTSFSNITDLIKLATMTTKSPLNVCKKNFTPLFKAAFEKALSVSSIKNGFRKCGVYPFDPSAIDEKRLMPSNDSRTANSSENTTSTISSETMSTTTQPVNSSLVMSTVINSVSATSTISTTIQPDIPSLSTSTVSLPTSDILNLPGGSTTTVAIPTPITVASSANQTSIAKAATDTVPVTQNPCHSDATSNVIATSLITSAIDNAMNLGFEEREDMLPDIDLTINSSILDQVPSSPMSDVIEFETSLTDVIGITPEQTPSTNPVTGQASMHQLLPGASSTPSAPSTPGASSTPSTSERMKRISPLISSGKIPASLLSSFIIPETSPQKRENKTRIITKARVMTSEESKKELRERMAAKKKEEEEKQRKREEREMKRLEKEKKKSKRRLEKNRGRKKGKKRIKKRKKRRKESPKSC